jgi:hypothetical protein
MATTLSILQKLVYISAYELQRKIYAFSLGDIWPSGTSF